jgi:RHS repeat-associated protein
MQISSYRLEPGTAGTATAYAPKLLSATDYFPFGMQMPGRVVVDGEGYRYGFNGMERENAVNEVGYDFGARLYNSWNGKWMAVDPLFKIYPSISSYAAMGNNPIYFIDVDGRRILIHYKTADNKNAYFEYKPGIKPVDNNFVRLAVATLDHLRLHDEGFGNSAKNMIDQFAYSRGLVVNIKETNTSAEIEMSGNQANINWSPFVGSVLVDDTGQAFGGTHSPMILLIHEFGHYEDYLNNPNFLEEEKINIGSPFYHITEQRVIEGIESSVAEFFGEGCRTNYFPVEFYRTTSPISTREQIIDTNTEVNGTEITLD